MSFELEIDGRRVRVNQQTQEVQVLDAAGTVAFSERIQVAAGSVQGIFSMLLNPMGDTQV
jgi:uncharacterized protein (AIM24 family)